MNSLKGGADAAGTASGGLYRLSTTVAPPILDIFLSRSYQIASAAVQPQFDYESYYDECGGESPVHSDLQIPAPTVDSEGSGPVKCVHWAFIGEPNTKKHVYAEMISKLLQVPHISIASLVRQELSPRSFLYKEEILDQLADINLVVNFKCSKGLKLSSEEADSNMSRFYKQQLELLEEYYRNQKKLIDFQVESAPRESWKGLLSVLHLQHLHAAQSSHVLDTGFRKP